MRRMLVIEDGGEYEEFATLFLKDCFEIHGVHSAAEALERLKITDYDCIMLDLRFDRSLESDLVGDLEETSERLFGGDSSAALGYLKEHQGTFILACLREYGYLQPVLFVHDFTSRRLENLRTLYGNIQAVPSFDAGAIKKALGCDS